MKDMIEYSRLPNKSEINFGHGCRIYIYLEKDKVKKKDGKYKSKIILDGVWWTKT